MGDSSRSSTESVSHSSTALHLCLAAFQVCLAGGEVITAGERASCCIEEDGAGDPGSGGGGMGPVTEAVGTSLRQRRRHRPLAGV
jgi:hypothetical protein